MHPAHEFDILYSHLSGAWESHQSLRRSHRSIAELAESSLQLHQARSAMWDWLARNSSVTF